MSRLLALIAALANGTTLTLVVGVAVLLAAFVVIGAHLGAHLAAPPDDVGSVGETVAERYGRRDVRVDGVDGVDADTAAVAESRSRTGDPGTGWGDGS
jgi:hypothetical protein